MLQASLASTVERDNPPSSFSSKDKFTTIKWLNHKAQKLREGKVVNQKEKTEGQNWETMTAVGNYVKLSSINVLIIMYSLPAYLSNLPIISYTKKWINKNKNHCQGCTRSTARTTS